MTMAHVEDMKIEWLSPNGKWKIIGKVVPDGSNFSHRTINIYRYEVKRERLALYSIGVGNNRKNMPGYVLEKYNEIHDQIRGRNEK